MKNFYGYEIGFCLMIICATAIVIVAMLTGNIDR